jgi:hypothetical protein
MKRTCIYMLPLIRAGKVSGCAFVKKSNSRARWDRVMLALAVVHMARLLQYFIPAVHPSAVFH